jgi:hypothetical protein
VLDEIRGGFLDQRNSRRVEVVAFRHQTQTLGDRATARSAEQLDPLMFDPRFSFGRAALVKGVRRTPEVFEHVNDIEHDRDLRADLARGTLDTLDLIALAVDQDDPPAPVIPNRRCPDAAA